MANGNGNGSRTVFESMMLRIVTPVIGALLIGVLGWMAASIVNNSSNIATIEAEIPLRTASRYTADDAKRDQDRQNDRFSYDEQRITFLESHHSR